MNGTGFDFLPLYAGRLGLAACPGLGAGALRNDLESGVRAVRDWPASLAITLMESRELEMLGLAALPERMRTELPLWLHLPIPDQAAPGLAWREQWSLVRLLVAHELQHGRDVFLHCLAGVGRTGTVAALCLMDAGECDAHEAITRVRLARSVHAIESAEQEVFVSGYRPASILTPEAVHAALAEEEETSGVRLIGDDGFVLPEAVARRLAAC